MVLLILLFFGAFMFFSFYYAILQSIKPMNEIFQYPPKFYVVHPTAENYLSVSLLVDNLWVPFGRYVVNTLFISVAGTVPVSYTHLQDKLELSPPLAAWLS